MPYPTVYTRQFNFQDDQIAHPSDKTPGQQIDAEFNAVKTSLDSTQTRLALIQRSDGALANASVGQDQLSGSLSIGFTLRGAWASGQNYALSDGVTYGAIFYKAKVANASTNANRPDLDSTTWTVLADFSGLVTQAAFAQRTAVTDTNYTGLAADRCISFVSISAARTVTLPAASAFPAGVLLYVIDESGSCSATNTITVQRAGSDTVNGSTSSVIGQAYGAMALESNGSNKWTVAHLRGAPTSATTYSAADGSVSSPSYGWASDPTSGFYRIAQYRYGLSFNGSLKYEFNATDLILPGNPTVALGAAPKQYVDVTAQRLAHAAQGGI